MLWELGVFSSGFSGCSSGRWTGLQLRASGSRCAKHSRSAIFCHASLALQNLTHGHGNTLETCQFWWDPPRNQADAEWHPPCQAIFESFPTSPPSSSPPGRLVGRWQAGDGLCQAPVSWLLGRGISQGLLAAGPPGQPFEPWKCSGESSGQPAYTVKSQGIPTSALQ